MPFLARACIRLSSQSLRSPAVHIRYASTKSSASSRSLPVPRPDYARILADPEATIRNIRERCAPTSLPPKTLIARISELHGQVATLQNRFQALRSERNSIGKQLASKSNDIGSIEAAKRRAEAIRAELSGKNGVEQQLESSQNELLQLASELPNWSSDESPIGGYEACKVEKTSNDQDVDAAELKPNLLADHVELMTALGWLYMPNHITGSSWPYLIRGGARLENALVQYGLSKANQNGFEAVIPPDVVKHEIMKRCGFNPRDSGGEAQTYFVSTSGEADGGRETDLALAATAEIPLAGYFMDKLYKYPEKELPQKLIATGHAFRAEAGARGKESRGLYRVHQFTKLELFAVTASEGSQSAHMLDEMVKLQWDILAGLGLPLRLLNMSTSELGGSAYKKYDIEAYMPGRGSWGELASASNCTDYQARRLAIRHRAQEPHQITPTSGPAAGAANVYCHTLNATAVAIPRLIVAIIEKGAIFENGHWVALQLPAALKPFWIGEEALLQTHELQISLTPDMSMRGQPTKVELQWTGTLPNC